MEQPWRRIWRHARKLLLLRWNQDKLASVYVEKQELLEYESLIQRGMGHDGMRTEVLVQTGRG